RRTYVAIAADLLERRTTHFVLWHPHTPAPVPELIIGRFQPGNPPSLREEQRFPLSAVQDFPDLFSIAAADCNLKDGQVYHYWYEIEDSTPGHSRRLRVRCTDPLAATIDWRLRADRLPPPFTADDRQPAAVVKFRRGQLVPCDPGGEESDFSGDPRPDTLPPNNQLVIDELPTAWSRISLPDDLDIGVGTFRDILALIDADALGANFDDLDITQLGRSYLTELGIN